MVEHFLIIEEGLLREKLIPLSDRLTIGRDEANDIQLSDPSVSKHHAVVRLLTGHPVIEDIGSRNGTFINDEQVRTALLHDGDTLKLGKSTLRFVKRTGHSMGDVPRETREVRPEDMAGYPSLHEGGPPPRRVLEALSHAPLFFGFTTEQLARVAQEARLCVFQAGKTVVRQGDRGEALYLILDGMVRVSACDNEGKEALLSFLKEDQIFGEMSFLTGLPSSATVRAEEETLVCELRGEVIHGIASTSPSLKTALEKYYREALKESEFRKKAAGITEKRRDARFNMALPVDFSVSPTAGVSAEVRDRVFQAESTDISLSGVRLSVQDLSLLLLPIGETIRLTISLPQSWGTIRCLGALRNVSHGKGNGDVACLGVKFVEIPIADKRALERFLTEGEAPAVEKILVAEDEEPLRNLLGKFLRSKGYEVALAATGVEVLEVAGRERPSLILLDVRMPELDGIAACMRLKKDEKTRAIQVIILTAFEDTLVDALEAGADDFLCKPCEFSEIAARIRAMLRVRHMTNDAERAAAYMKELQKAITLH
jgi:two-component system alkaline phosphatase synthesis response regulator PhoP